MSKRAQFTMREKRALQIAAQDPTLNNNQIGKRLKELGVVKSELYLHDRVKENQALSEKLTILRQKGDLQIEERLPKVLKVFDKRLKDNKKEGLQLRAAEGLLKARKTIEVNEKPSISMVHIDQVQVLVQQQFEKANNNQ